MLHAQCLVALGTSHLRVVVIEVVVPRLFGIWFEAQVFWQEKKS